MVVLTGIFHLDSCPRPAWALCVIFFLLHSFASLFFWSRVKFLLLPKKGVVVSRIVDGDQDQPAV
jgi:hypothetical protein